MRYQDIKWEEESEFEEEGKKTGKNQVEELSFEELLKQESMPQIEIRRGSQVSGVISAISTTSDNVLIELDALHTGVMDKNQAEGMPASVLASKILKAIQSDKQEIYVGGKEILAVYIKRFFPRLLSKIVRKQNR